MLKKFLRAHGGDVHRAQAALEDALTWHARMRHSTDYQGRMFDPVFRGLASVTTHQRQGPGPSGQMPEEIVVIWHFWGSAGKDDQELFDKTDT